MKGLGFLKNNFSDMQEKLLINDIMTNATKTTTTTVKSVRGQKYAEIGRSRLVEVDRIKQTQGFQVEIVRSRRHTDTYSTPDETWQYIVTWRYIEAQNTQ